jgi:UDP-N-acetylglucosamine enolpyruvyl transferase
MVVDGKSTLSGIADVGGFKHSLVTVMAAAAVAQAPVHIRNVPMIAETECLGDFLGACGASVDSGPSGIRVDASSIGLDADADRVLGGIHGGVYLLPGLLAKTGTASLPVGGGCQIGDGAAQHRPMEQYIDVLKRFGATEGRIADGRLTVSAPRLSGCEIDLRDYCADRRLRTGPLYSGASKMALLAAAVATGVTRLSHLYPKPDVLDLIEVLRRLGADIVTGPDGTVTVAGHGGRDLVVPAEFTLPADLIEVVTWVTAGALFAEPSLTVRGTGLDRALAGLAPELRLLAEMGVEIDSSRDQLTVHRADTLKPFHLVVSSHGVYSDSQPFLALLAGHADGRSVLVETVWKQRFGYAEELRRLGMHLSTVPGELAVSGVRPPNRAGQTVFAADLRAAAVLVLAALGVEGRTTVLGTSHLRRGYADFAGTLGRLGARISEGETE